MEITPEMHNQASHSSVPTYLQSVIFYFSTEREEPTLIGTSRSDNWLVAQMADFTSLYQVFLSLGLDLVSLHEEQSFFTKTF